MKKGSGGAVADKKKARHASTSDTPPRKQAAKRDVFQLFAEKVRDHKDLESRWAVLQETRVEYFRGKDFLSFLRNHPELKNILESDRNLEVEDIANVLLRKNLLVRCDRVVKTVRPGKKKLSTWPAHLEIFPMKPLPLHDSIEVITFHFLPGCLTPNKMAPWLSFLLLLEHKVAPLLYRNPGDRNFQVFSDNDAFFAWTFVRRHPLWQTLLSFSWPVLTLAICLFPVYPHRCKLLILYSCASVLLLILCLLLLRALAFGAGWILLGKRIWLFPNILAEEATLKELFQFWPQKDEGEPPKWTARLFFAVVSVLVILLLKHHAPDEAARARYQKRVYNIIDDVLEWSPRLALSGMMEKQSVINATEANNFTEGGKSNPEEVVIPEDGQNISQDEAEEGIGVVESTDQHKFEEEIENIDDTDHQHQRNNDL